jgi:type 1 glutamine amidotransferase
MREALIVWGGWSGHEPEQCASIIAGMLEEEGFKVSIENTTEAFADPDLSAMSLIIPIYTMSRIEREELSNLTAAVRGGVGLAGYHGGRSRRGWSCRLSRRHVRRFSRGG